MNINLKRIIFGLAIVVVAVVGGIFTNMGTEWYATLVKPSEWPPSFLFPVVWSTIYILSFVTLFLLTDRGMPKSTIVLFAVNGILNIVWCLTFFALRQIFLGEVIIIVNLIAGFLLVAELKKRGDLYFYLMIIYPVWLGVATALNTAVWILN